MNEKGVAMAGLNLSEMLLILRFSLMWKILHSLNLFRGF